MAAKANRPSASYSRKLTRRKLFPNGSLWNLFNVEEDPRQQKAMRLFREAYQHQMDKEFNKAIELYKKSIEAYPMAEAYTFLGWTYSFMGRIDDAIAECH